jgi:hypothetical protein
MLKPSSRSLKIIKTVKTEISQMSKTFFISILSCIFAVTLFAENYSWGADWRPEGDNEKLKIITDVSDGLVEYSQIKGRKCVSTTGMFLYFDVVDDFAYELNADTKLEMQIYDAVKSDLYLHYDSMTEKGRVSYRNSSTVKTSGDGTFKTVTLDLPGAWFAGGENHGADFRFVIPRDICISKIKLYVAGLKDKNFESKKQAENALVRTRYKQKIESYNSIVSSMSDILIVAQRLQENLDKQTWDELTKYYHTWLSHNQLYNQIVAAANKDIPVDNIDSVLIKARDYVNVMKSCYSVMKGKETILTFFNNLFPEQQNRPDTVYYCTPAVSKGLPASIWTTPANSQVNSIIEVTACRGEYEPCIVGILSLNSHNNITIDLSDLIDKNGDVIESVNIDIKVVEYWYQAGQTNETKGPRQLIPELLVHDDSFVDVDLINQKNILNFADQMPDPQNLQPFNINALENKQLWVTFYVPQNTPSGIYSGNISITADKELKVPVMLKVPAFDLKSNPKIASMYFSNHKWSRDMSQRKYIRMLVDMREHGLVNPTVVLMTKPDGSYDIDAARTELALRKRLGMNKGPLLSRGWYNVASYLRDNAPIDERKEKIKKTLDTVNAIADEFGYSDAYIYAIDEAAGEELAMQVPVFEYVDKIDGKVWSAVLSDFGTVPVAVENMHMPNYSGIPPLHLTQKVHQAGNKMIRYGYPQGGAEYPWLWRYHFGLILWENEIDGGCTWTYRSGNDNPWNDFDCTGRRCSYRDFMMTYPGVHEPVSTIQWEAYREACDDLRYMYTLEELQKELVGKDLGQAESIEKWLSTIKQNGMYNQNLDMIKKHIINYLNSNI